MRDMRIKICGIRDVVALDAAAEAGADWVGFVFFPPSPRWVTPMQARELARRIPSGIGPVGLFVEPTDADIEAVLREVRLDALQVYAATPRIAELHARFGLPIWHALGVGAASDLPTEPGGADRLVLEARPPEGANRPGGNAAPFDWSLLRGWTAPAPWILAGGLAVATVGQAIRQTGARAVDVSSGVESAPGVKDPALIRAFIAAARA
ncbi:MAG: phosphoribosylanthranilate isomerase [Acetobacteraceae bacterium]